MKHNGYHTEETQAVLQDRTYPSSDQLLAERYPDYGEVFLEFHCKSQPFERRSYGRIAAEDAKQVATEILENLKKE